MIMILMVAIIFMLFIFAFIFSVAMSGSTSTPYGLLMKALNTQRFSDIRNIHTSDSLIVIRADSNVENYLFGVKRAFTSSFTSFDIARLRDLAGQYHTHSVVIVVSEYPSYSDPIYKMLRTYNIDVWDYEKVYALASEMSSATSSHDYYTLKTSDTSDDTCKIDSSSFDPIQEETAKPHSLFSGLFQKPDRL